ncbi:MULTISPECIES: SH3 domain-containing protein [unclassified Okeania]|uniref:SH3 domain-containing protein n=1 Tax=unclassified Okeania TaxID=2634635 RepID=UPI0013BF5D99|nr:MULTISPECIES: SH3 domain-containing protein [unclassified Okeania]NET28153.1 SH3 domain-containing protein [Okeania sp. SIO1I7]NET40990.1 SH3 domain-containing protein [Okeania sp. SIO2B3]
MNNWKKYLTTTACAFLCLLELKIVAQAITTETSIRAIPKYQLAQTPVGYCTVGNLTDSPLNVREKPDGEIIGTLESGTVVALGVTDGSEGENWTRIITPIEGYVSAKYLKDCQYKY